MEREREKREGKNRERARKLITEMNTTLGPQIYCWSLFVILIFSIMQSHSEVDLHIGTSILMPK